MVLAPISSHQVQLNRKARPRDGWRQGCDRCPVQVDQVPVASDPAPDEELAAIAGAPELPADVPAREPDALVSDPAEQGWSGRPDDRDILKRDEVIGVFCVHGAILLPESAPSTRG